MSGRIRFLREVDLTCLCGGREVVEFNWKNVGNREVLGVEIIQSCGKRFIVRIHFDTNLFKFEEIFWEVI